MHTPSTEPPGAGGPDDRPPTVEDAFRAGAPPSPPPPPQPDGPPDPAALFALLDGLRRVAPRELEQQFTALTREFLLTLRALIDWYLERLDRQEPEPQVEDIPID
jgi:hypothetical protein